MTAPASTAGDNVHGPILRITAIATAHQGRRQHSCSICAANPCRCCRRADPSTVPPYSYSSSSSSLFSEWETRDEDNKAKDRR